MTFAPILTLYVQGYRFDFENKKLTQTGGFFIKTIQPKQADIYLDGKFFQTTDFFFSSALIENLLPKKYNVKIQKNDYRTWEKNLEIKEKQVVEIRSIVLIPEDPGFKLLATNVNNIWFSKDKKRAIIKEKDKDFWSLKLYNFEKNIKTHLLKETDIYETGAGLEQLGFKDNNTLLLEIAKNEQIIYFELQIDKIPSVLRQVKSPQPIIEDVLVYQENDNQIYYIDDSGHLYKTNKSLSSKEQLTEKPFEVKKETLYKLYVFDEFIFLQQNQAIYLLNQENKEFEKFSENIISLKVSPNLTKMVYSSDSEIRIFFLKAQTIQPRFNKAEDMFLMRLSESIKNVFWLNSDYLIIDIGNSLKITEIDNRDKINIYEIATVQNPELFLDHQTDKLYLLDRGNLFVSEKFTL
ncbi:MAG: hypothetical protein KJI70_00995 [Patescibacteria group bacterium]|nr:hypothetical protein [Patescibacteria group bacterium]